MMRHRKTAVPAVVGLFLSLALLAILALPLSAQQLELRFLDVGQADAILVREGGKTALIDAGGGAGVLAQLRALGVDTIDLLVASHNRTDRDGAVIIQAQRDGSYVVLQETPGLTDPGCKPGVEQTPPARSCCRTCTTGKACGNSCISRRYQCRQPPGACDAKP